MPKHKHSYLAAATYAVFFLPFLTGEKNDSFVKYHFKQSVTLVISALALQGVLTVLGYWISTLGFFGLLGGLLTALLWVVRIFLVYEVVMGAKNAIEGKEEPLPYIGEYAKAF